MQEEYDASYEEDPNLREIDSLLPKEAKENSDDLYYRIIGMGTSYRF